MVWTKERGNERRKRLTEQKNGGDVFRFTTTNTFTTNNRKRKRVRTLSNFVQRETEEVKLSLGTNSKSTTSSRVVMENEDYDHDMTGGGDSVSSRWKNSKTSKVVQDDEIEDVTPTVSPNVEQVSNSDDDEPEILESSSSINLTKVLKNPLHSNREPEFIDLTNEEDVDQNMASELDDSDVIVEDMPESKFDEDDDMPELVEVTPLSKKDIAEQQRAIGNSHFKLAEYNQALAAYNGAIALVPTEVSFYGNRAACYMMMSRYQEALADTQICIKIDPNYEKSYVRLVRINLALGDAGACQAAILHYSGLNLNTDISTETIKLQALQKLQSDIQISTSRKDFRRVLYLCDRVLDIANADIDIRIRKGFVLVKLGRYTEAAEMAAEVMNIDGHNVDAHVIRALCHYQLDNMDKSLSFFKGALQRSPDAVEPKILYRQVKQIKEHREIATEQYKQGKHEESKALYLDCMKIVTSEGDLKNTCLEAKFSFNLSLIFNKQRMYEDATQFASKAIEINPSYYKAFVHRATIHNSREMYEEAARDFEAALKLDPSKRELRNDIQNAKMAAKKAKRKNYYKILDIPQGATDDDIRKAYKKRAMLHHPDRHAGAPEAVQKEQEKNFKDVGEAYEILSDPKKRFRYDQGHDLMEANNSGGGFCDPYDANQLFNMFFSSGGGTGGMGHPGQHQGGRGGGARYYNAGGRGGGCSFQGFQR